MKTSSIIKAIAIAQSVTAPALMLIGHKSGNKRLRNISALWCGLIALDTARLSWMLLDTDDFKAQLGELEKKDAKKPEKCSDGCPNCPGLFDCEDYQDRIANCEEPLPCDETGYLCDEEPCSYMSPGCKKDCGGPRTGEFCPMHFK